MPSSHIYCEAAFLAKRCYTSTSESLRLVGEWEKSSGSPSSEQPSVARPRRAEVLDLLLLEEKEESDSGKSS